MTWKKPWKGSMHEQGMRQICRPKRSQGPMGTRTRRPGQRQRQRWQQRMGQRKGQKCIWRRRLGPSRLESATMAISARVAACSSVGRSSSYAADPQYIWMAAAVAAPPTDSWASWPSSSGGSWPPAAGGFHSLSQGPRQISSLATSGVDTAHVRRPQRRHRQRRIVAQDWDDIGRCCYCESAKAPEEKVEEDIDIFYWLNMYIIY